MTGAVESRPESAETCVPFSTKLFLAFCCIYLVADFGIGAMPVFFGALVDERHLSLDVAGSVAASETTGLAIGSLIAFLLIARSSITARRLAAGSLLVSISAQLASAISVDILPLMASRFVSGMCAAVLQGAALAWISRTPHPQRPIAVFVGMSFLSGTIGMPLFSLSLNWWGLDSTYLFLAILLMATMLLVRVIPIMPLMKAVHVSGKVTEATNARVHSRAIRRWPLLVAIALNYIFNGGVWVYFERMGQWAGFDTTRSAAVLGLGMFVALASTIGLAVAGSRARNLWVVFLGHLTLIMATAAFIKVEGWAMFAGAILVFHVGIALLPAAMLATLASVDPSGRAALQGMVAINIGFALGPQVYSWLVTLYGLTASLQVAIAVFILSLLLFLSAKIDFRFFHRRRIDPGSLGGM